MEYTNGYVAFIDILGFSNLVSNEQSADKVKDLFEFVKKIQYLFNSSPELNANVAFFSDSIILSTNNQVKDNLDNKDKEGAESFIPKPFRTKSKEEE